MKPKSHNLTKEEFTFLSTSFGLIEEKNRYENNCIKSKDLLDPKRCLSILEYLTPILNSPSIKVTASMLSKRIAFLTTASCLYSMSVYNKALDLCLENCFFDYNHDNGLWISKLPIKDLSVSSYENINTRNEWREKILKSLFAKHLNPLWDILSQISGISKNILWENTAVRVYSLYENKIKEVDYSKDNNYVERDFNFLISSKSYELFGADFNPIEYFYNAEKTNILNKKNRKRKTCCFYYKSNLEKNFCNTCPLKK